MTVFYDTTVSTSAIFYFASSLSGMIVTQTGQLICTGYSSTVISSESNSNAVIDGSVVSQYSSALFFAASYASVTIGSNGSALGETVGIVLSDEADWGMINNYGDIVGDWGVIAYGDNVTINNAGTITGTANGVYPYAESGVFVVNRSDDLFHYSQTINNSGLIVGGEYAIYAGEQRVYSYHASDTVINNSGTLIGGSGAAVYLGRGDDTVVNSGHIVGDVLMGGEDDIFDGRGGTVDGYVYGDGGDDVFLIDDDQVRLVERDDEGYDQVEAYVSHTLGANFEALTLGGSADLNGFGNAMDNEIIGNDGDNTIVARSGADTVEAGGGDDVIIGGAGVDDLQGQEGNDRIRGGAGNDRIDGGNDDDILFGSGGRDTIFGGYGEDMIYGGADRDTLFGGLDADVFVYRAVSDSTLTGSDLIRDFNASQDLIDLSAVVASEIQFNGFGPHSGTGASLIINSDGQKHVIQIDTDGDGNSDMQIQMENATGSLTEDVFIL